MNNYEEQYINLLNDICEVGTLSKNRTGINTRKVWGAQMYVNLQSGFPLLTTKKMHWKSVVHELLWMIKGDTNIQYLLKNGVTFWTEWPYQKYLNHCKTLTDPDYDVHIEDLEKNCVREMTQKEFEQEIINNDEFAKTWGSIGQYGYGGMWRKFPFYDDSDPHCNKVPTTTTIGAKLDCHETSGGYACEVGHVDQLVDVIDTLKNNPDSRRIIITAWHPYHSNNREDALLPACHNYIQFGTEELTLEERFNIFSNGWNVEEAKNEWNKNGFTDYDSLLTDHYIPKYRLNCYFNMRSTDAPLGLPYNIAFYALFTHLMAHCLNMIPSQLVYSGADVHIYENQQEGITEQLTRTPGKLPKLVLKPECPTNLFDIKFDHIDIVDYNPQAHIKMPVAV
jgi:thymidylate synthase